MSEAWHQFKKAEKFWRFPRVPGIFPIHLRNYCELCELSRQQILSFRLHRPAESSELVEKSATTSEIPRHLDIGATETLSYNFPLVVNKWTFHFQIPGYQNYLKLLQFTILCNFLSHILHFLLDLLSLPLPKILSNF